MTTQYLPDPAAGRAQVVGIDYRVRLSRRARRLQLHVFPHGEVEVVLPRGMNPEVVAPFVARHRGWILRTRARLMQRAPQAVETGLPVRIYLRAIDRGWRVDFQPTGDAGLEECQDDAGDVLFLRAPDERAACRLLQRWLSRQGRLHLVPWLEAVAAETGLRHGRVSVRGQRTRWGSCSSRGSLSLNRALLFLQPSLVRQLFIHELCHTVHLNHSPRFWRLVARHSPRYRELERALSQAAVEVPRWALARE